MGGHIKKRLKNEKGYISEKDLTRRVNKWEHI